MPRAAGGGLSDASDDPNESELVPQFMKFMLPEATSAERLDHYREYFVTYEALARRLAGS